MSKKAESVVVLDACVLYPAIIQQKEIPDRESLKKLLRHHFIQKNVDNQYYLQVPLFEMWVRKFEIDL